MQRYVHGDTEPSAADLSSGDSVGAQRRTTVPDMRLHTRYTRAARSSPAEGGASTAANVPAQSAGERCSLGKRTVRFCTTRKDRRSDEAATESSSAPVVEKRIIRPPPQCHSLEDVLSRRPQTVWGTRNAGEEKKWRSMFRPLLQIVFLRPAGVRGHGASLRCLIGGMTRHDQVRSPAPRRSRHRVSYIPPSLCLFLALIILQGLGVTLIAPYDFRTQVLRFRYSLLTKRPVASVSRTPTP